MDGTIAPAPLGIEWAAELGLGWADALLVVLATVGIYLAVVVVTRIRGPRPLASFSTFDIVVSVAIGSLVGRVVLVRTSLLAGILGLVVLIGLQSTVRHLRYEDEAAFVEPHARLLVWDGHVVEEQLRWTHVTQRDLHAQLRAAGIADVRQVRAAVFERDGAISVIPAGTPLDLAAFADVSGVPEQPTTG